MKYVVDGYNVIHKIEALKSKRLFTQRESLIQMIEAAVAKNKSFKDVTVVFDGKDGVVAPIRHSTVKIIFSKKTCADKKIKHLLESSSFARDIGVVSDDRQVRFYANSVGAKRISVEEFLKRLNLAEKKRITPQLTIMEKNIINNELGKIWLK